MSSIGKTVSSNLPEDVEERIAYIQESISLLERKNIDLDSEVEAKKNIVSGLNDKILVATSELNKIISEQETRISSLNDREAKIVQKESALDIYANALKEKEDRINKYLAIFENMKSVVSK
jgi:chromosome segregation ATPase